MNVNLKAGTKMTSELPPIPPPKEEAKQRKVSAQDKTNFEIPISNKWLLLTKLYLLSFGFTFSIVWAMVQESTFEVSCGSNGTQTAVNNFPSLAFATGHFQTANIVWKLCITVASLMDAAQALLELKTFSLIVKPEFQFLVYSGFAFRLLMLVGVMGLSYVSIFENFGVHLVFMGMFEVFLNALMICSCYLLFKCREIPCMSTLEEQSQRLKLKIMAVSLTSTVLGTYFYQRHMLLCEDSMFSIFACFEYVLIVCGMVFLCLPLLNYQGIALRVTLGSSIYKYGKRNVV